MFRIAIDGKSDIGRKRTENEDAVFWSGDSSTPFSFMIVADGMGGYHGGATASRIAVKTVADKLSGIQSATFSSCTPQQQPLILKSELVNAITEANQAILDCKVQNPQFHQMGTTLVVCIIWESQLMVAHIGDSRAYQWDQHYGLKQLTRDHSVVQQMIDSGAITEEEARVSKMRNQLTKALGVNLQVEPVINEFAINNDCLLLLCSDGMTEYFTNREIERILATHRPSLECCYRFIDESNQKGGKDNITVTIAEYLTVQAQQAEPQPDATVPFSF